MAMNQSCPVDGCERVLVGLDKAKKHYRENHSGEIETPEKYLNTFPDTVQKDFYGEDPTTEGHNPEYLPENETPETRDSTLFEHERTEDTTLQEHTEEDTE